MNVTIAVYQERVGAELHWVTLGLGAHTQRERGPHAGKLQQKITNALRDAFMAAPARDLARVGFVRGTRLEVLHLELGLRHEGRRRKLALLCPVVVEPRWASDDRRFVIAYHPARQEQWFPVDEAAPLAEQATAFFAEDWAELDDATLDGLRLRGRCTLKSFSFTASPKGLLDELSERPRGVWDDLRNDGPQRDAKRKDVLRPLGVDVTWQCVDGSLTASLPRSPWREQVRLLLCQPTPQPLLVVGPSGVGRTRILERAVADLLEHDGYPSHRNPDLVRHVWQVSGKRLIAGMSYLGDWQARCLDVLAEARERRVVLWVTDIEHFGRIGRTRDSEMNLAEFFAGPVARREVTLVGECAPEALRQLEEDAPAFAALFTRVQVAPADTAETLRMLLHEVRRLETLHDRLRVHPSALRTILELGAALAPMRAQPGKSMDLLARTVRDCLAESVEGNDVFVGSWQVAWALSARTGLPMSLLEPGDALRGEDVARVLGAQVMGQTAAIDAAVDVVTRVRAGMVDARRPYAVYLFVGPTGTGKTELAKALARYLYGSVERLVRFDMGEFGASDAAARLVGDRWNPDGVLTRALQAQPFCVVLLDEIEKAHPQVHNLLLQVFDEGRLTDAAGVPASFTHAVVLMTSNLGARREAVAGFGAVEVTSDAEHLRAVREFFAPELFNRIDRVVPFRALTPEVARAVVARELAKLSRRRGLLERDVFVMADDAVLDRVVRDAFQAADGARALKRWLEDRVGTALTELLVQASTPALRLVRLDHDLTLHVETLREAEALAADFPLEACFSEPLPRLQARLADARHTLDAVAASPALAALSTRIRELLVRRDADDALYTLESLRGEIAALREHLETLERASAPTEDWELRALEIEHRDQHVVDAWSCKVLRFKAYDRRAVSTPVAPTRHAVLDALTEVAVLQRALERADDRGQHTAVVTLRHVVPIAVGREGEAPREGNGLLGQLALTYARCRGAFVEANVRSAHAPALHTRDLAELPDSVASPACVEVTLRLSGIGIWDYLRDEHGVHVWRSLAHPPELVQVSVQCDAGEVSPSNSEHESDGRSLVRSIRFDPALATGGVAPIEVEDYRSGVVRAGSARCVTDPVDDLLRIRAARQIR